MLRCHARVKGKGNSILYLTRGHNTRTYVVLVSRITKWSFRDAKPKYYTIILTMNFTFEEDVTRGIIFFSFSLRKNKHENKFLLKFKLIAIERERKFLSFFRINDENEKSWWKRDVWSFHSSRCPTRAYHLFKI